MVFISRSYLFPPAPFAQTLTRPTKEGHPDTVVRGLGSIRAVCRAWRALKVVFSAGGGVEWIRRFPGFLFEAFFFVPQASFIFRHGGILLIIHASLKTARYAATLGFLCRDRFGVHSHPRLGALRAVCHVPRVQCVPCVMQHFFKQKIKTCANDLP